MSNKTMFLFSPLVVILFLTLTYAQEAGGGGESSPLPSGGGGGIAANYTVEYDPAILEAFNNQTWLPVLVRLKDNSNITVTGTKEERRALLIQQDEWFKLMGDKFYASLSEDDFKGERGSIRTTFVGLINKNGFESLLNDSRVKAISWAKYEAHTTSENESISNKNKSITENNTTEKVESKIATNLSKHLVIEEKKEKNLLWLWVTIAFILTTLIFYLVIKIKKR